MQFKKRANWILDPSWNSGIWHFLVCTMFGNWRWLFILIIRKQRLIFHPSVFDWSEFWKWLDSRVNIVGMYGNYGMIWLYDPFLILIQSIMNSFNYVVVFFSLCFHYIAVLLLHCHWSSEMSGKSYKDLQEDLVKYNMLWPKMNTN